MVERDPLIAAPGSVPTRSPGGPPTLGDCARVFARHDSPKILVAAIAAALAVRLALGHYSWRDAVIPLALIALEPLTEWVIHVYLLHARPVRIGERRMDLPTAREHRAHHLAPAELDGVLIPTYGILIFLPMIAATAWGLSFALHPLLGGDRLAGAATGLLAAYAVLFTYEWCHFLIHTPYRPRGPYYRSIWRSHRLHHYKNERYWFGVTSNLGDRVLGTYPEAAAVRRSRTARTLGSDG
jgi:fatty acid hydroxylase family protein